MYFIVMRRITVKAVFPNLQLSSFDAGCCLRFSFLAWFDVVFSCWRTSTSRFLCVVDWEMRVTSDSLSRRSLPVSFFSLSDQQGGSSCRLIGWLDGCINKLVHRSSQICFPTSQWNRNPISTELLSQNKRFAKNPDVDSDPYSGSRTSKWQGEISEMKRRRKAPDNRNINDTIIQV